LAEGFFKGPGEPCRFRSPGPNKTRVVERKNSLDPGQIETYQVARWFRVSPEEVENWTNRDFLDRQEFMLLGLDAEKQIADQEAAKVKRP